MCSSDLCRLRLDLRELRKKSGGFFGSGESTGSVGVVTINLPRIAYLSKTVDEFYSRLDHLMDVSARSLSTKRKIITDLLNNNFYPYTKRYLGTFKNHFSTIGLVGMNEACLNACWLRDNLTEVPAQKFSEEVLNHMRNRLVIYQEKYGDLYNLEATPAESTAYRLAKHDVAKYPDIITAGKPGETPYYTNSSHLPVGFTSDIFDALDIQDKLQVLYTSGTVFHAFLGEKLPSWQSAAQLVKKIAVNYKLPYYTMSPTYSICPEHGYLVGEQYKCPMCGKETEVWSRITGYYRPVKNWNNGKTQEFKERKTYDISNSTLKQAHFAKDLKEEQEECIIKVKESYNEVDKKNAKIYLFSTVTCPNCKMAKTLLKQANIDYEEKLASENILLVEKYDIHTAPTLVVIQDSEVLKYEGASAIKDFINE